MSPEQTDPPDVVAVPPTRSRSARSLVAPLLGNKQALICLVVIVFFVLAFAAAGVAGLFGAFITKAAPVA